MLNRLDRGVVLVLLTASSLVGCFQDVGGTAETGSESGTDELSDETGEPGETGQPETSETETEPETETETETDTGVCDAVDCPCDGVSDCADGLECIAGQCYEPVCGDTIVSAQEQCDDGNAADGDGCDSDCTYTEILVVDAGAYHNCVLIEGGRVRCWGFGLNGQLGLGANEIIGDDELPSEAADVNLPSPAVQIAVSSDQHTCALLEDGSVRCWGLNEYGQLGYANTQPRNTPGPAVQVGAAVSQLETGAFHTCIRTSANAVRCWGRGSLGRLGYGSTANIGDDEQPSSAGNVMVGGPAARLASGGAHNCIVSQIGTVRCWGRGDLGQLGYGNTENIGDNEVPSTAGDASVIPMGLGPLTKATQLSIGVAHTCAVFETGDGLCWGDATFGQLGRGNTQHLGDNELPSTAPALDLPSKIVSITAAGAHSCALLEDGDAYCWGSNTFGQLGYGHTNHIGDNEAPASGGPIELGASVVQIDAGFFHTCALLSNNEVRCWGNNDGGQLGLGHMDKIGDDELPIEEPPIAIF